MGFRYDINGLRTFAVISVVLFHYNASLLSGGFAGVDIFFVISGYLMTRIIIKDLDDNKFKLTKFYISRVNRIVPPLLFLCFSLFIFGWFFLNPLDFVNLSKHIYSSLGFFSNVTYWLESGYFDASSKDKWLLHTWSLSVEWQFYIFYPIFLIVAFKIFGSNLSKKLIVISTILLFSFSVYATFKWPNPSYYLLPTRGWELLVGACAFLFPITKFNKATEGFGYLCIVFSVLVINDAEPWPGYGALLPVIGCYFIICSNNQNNKIFNNGLVQYLGKISYSVYLWHWPVMVFGRYFITGDWVVPGIIISILFGMFSYHVIEGIKFKRIDTFIKIYQCKLVYPVVILGSICWLAFITQGANFQFKPLYDDPSYKYLMRYKSSEYLESLHDFDRLADSCNFFDYFSTNVQRVRENLGQECINYGNSSGKKVFVWGDSHAQALAQGFRSDSSISLTQVATSSCNPTLGQSVNQKLHGVNKNACDKSNKTAFELIKRTKPDVVFIAQRHFHEKTNFDAIAKELKLNGVNNVILVGPTPQWSGGLPELIARHHSNNSDVRIAPSSLIKDIVKTDTFLKSTPHEYKYISLIDSLCTSQGCLMKVDDNNTPLVFDYGHLTKEGSVYIYNNIIKELI